MFQPKLTHLHEQAKLSVDKFINMIGPISFRTGVVARQATSMMRFGKIFTEESEESSGTEQRETEDGETGNRVIHVDEISDSELLAWTHIRLLNNYANINNVQ